MTETRSAPHFAPRFLQIHTLHSYTAALLNRDDTGQAKRLMYGNTSRTRISSQCLKRHWRMAQSTDSKGRLIKDDPHALQNLTGYVVVDMPGLISNCGGDRALAARVVHHLVHLIAEVSPGAKLGSTAPFGRADLMLIEAGDRQPRSLATAFRKAISHDAKAAVDTLAHELATFDEAYATGEKRAHLCLRGVLPNVDKKPLSALPETEGPSREDVYRDWLRERLAPVALLAGDATRLFAHERSIVLRGGRKLEGPDVTLHGELTITDPAMFTKLIAHGVGRHTAYGYGMLLLRPARS
jgi:hypothetical protein